MKKRFSIAEVRRPAVLAHSDVDGLCSAAVLKHALSRDGRDVPVEITRKGESAWSSSVAERLARHHPEALIVADLSVRARSILQGTPTIFIDHHRPHSLPDDAEVVSGYGLDPVPTSALLALRWADGGETLEWLAAMSAVGDLADEGAFPEVVRGLARFRRSDYRRAVSLLNAPRRSASGDATVAFEWLLRAEGPRDLLTGPAAEYLAGAKAEVDSALADARRVAPLFAGEFALLRIKTPCQVHPLVAQAWRGRLRRNIVICANYGYLPGRVNFAVRTALDVNLIDVLRQHAPAEAGEDFAQGHDKATGGSLTPRVWERFAASLGFGGSANGPP